MTPMGKLKGARRPSDFIEGTREARVLVVLQVFPPFFFLKKHTYKLHHEIRIDLAKKPAFSGTSVLLGPKGSVWKDHRETQVRKWQLLHSAAKHRSNLQLHIQWNI
uniref:Uncharacterized protein n=1 Tax=Utricularia reniformis TaxID=192314 RepID=A0A1Y0B3D4_9LAMI|nr:hypothetical protein AEK19_MT1677 [Utricularia reniformis]ART31859.1 hypothetical protein AEK19_MT1677 [Utricularia reniformis]